MFLHVGLLFCASVSPTKHFRTQSRPCLWLYIIIKLNLKTQYKTSKYSQLKQKWQIQYTIGYLFYFKLMNKCSNLRDICLSDMAKICQSSDSISVILILNCGVRRKASFRKSFSPLDVVIPTDWLNFSLKKEGLFPHCCIHCLDCTPAVGEVSYSPPQYHKNLLLIYFRTRSSRPPARSATVVWD